LPADRHDAEDRKARIDQILEELRLNTEDLHELAKQASERARQTILESRSVVAKARQSSISQKKR
jgi:hypothetical protein